jgi:hypothetical protein
VDRELLFQMIKMLGVSGRMLQYIAEFLLRKRSSKVIFGDGISKERVFKKGVPQGSPLSPLLFNMYMSGLKEIERGDNISQFADDLVIWETDDFVEVAAARLNKRLKKLAKWADGLGLQFSPSKCTEVKFTRKRKSGGTPTLRMKGSEIPYDCEAKYLGLAFEKGVTWKSQITNIVKVASKRVGILSFLSHQNRGLNQKVMLTQYKTLVRPVLEYGSEIWGDASPTNLKKLDSIQHRALTRCLGVNRLAHKKDVNFEACVLLLHLR